jgi:hypothetical protein
MTFEEYLYNEVFRKRRWFNSLSNSPTFTKKDELNLFGFTVTTPNFDIEYTIADEPAENSRIVYLSVFVWYKTEHTSYAYRVFYDVVGDNVDRDAEFMPYESLLVTVEDDLEEQIKDELLIKMAIL